MKKFREWLIEHNLAEEKWIQKAIKHPGRCASPGDEKCPEGSPQYNLAMRFKKGDLHDKGGKKKEKEEGEKGKDKDKGEKKKK